MRIAAKYTQASTDACMKWLKECRNRMVAGEVIHLDPFCEVTFEPADVDAALKGVETYIWSEIQNAGGTHATWQHARVPGSPVMTKDQLHPPRFLELPYPQRLAIMQGCYRVMNPFRATDETDAEEYRAKEAAIAQAKAYAEERARNLAANPHYYDYEYYEYC